MQPSCLPVPDEVSTAAKIAKPPILRGTIFAWQPLGLLPRQLFPSMTATSESPVTVTKSCWVVGSKAIERASERSLFGVPTPTANGVCPQPELSLPLQVEPSITDTVPSSRFPTKIVSVFGSTPTERGPAPTAIVATALPHPLELPLLQVEPSITETVLSFVLVT